MNESTPLQGVQKDLAQASHLFEEKIREMLAVRRVWGSLKHIRDVRKVFEALLDAILDEANAEHGAILLLNRETGDLTVRASRASDSGRQYPVPDARVSLRMDGRTAEWLKAQRGKAISIPDATQDNRFITALLPAGPVGALLCLPMIIQDEIVGLLTLSHAEPRAFTEEDRRVAAALTEQVALALNSVQAFDELQRFNEALKSEVDKATGELRQANEELRNREEELKELNAGLEERVRLRTLELQALYERMNGLVEYLPEGVFLLDEDLRLIVVNPAARAYLGDLAEAGKAGALLRVGGRPVADLLKPREDGLAHEVTDEGPPRRVFEVQARPIGEGRIGGGWVLVMRDVTQEREMQERLQRQDRLAVVGQLAAGVAHDFNNLLMGIIGAAELLEMREDTSVSAKEDLRTIVTQGQRGAQLIRQVLDFSRQTFAQRRPIDLRPLLKEIVERLRRNMPETVRVEADLGEETHLVEANPDQVRQILLNTATNAKDAMPDGGVLRIGLSRLRLRPEQPPPLPGMAEGDYEVLTVADTGTGMPPEVLAHIYEPFFTTKGTGKGSGLGLSQAYGIVKQHRGEIAVESAVGKGTIFTVYLPGAAVRTEEPARPAPGPQRGRGETVLVVEDETEVLRALRILLERMNYRALTASDGREALDVYEAHRDEIALVLTDLVMPEIGGLELFEALKRKNPDVRVVMMTGFPLGKGGGFQPPEGIAGFLEKPISMRQVAEMIGRLLTGTL